MYFSKLTLGLQIFLLLALTAICFGQSPAKDAAPPSPQLKLNVPVEGEIPDGGKRKFALHLDSNQIGVVVLNQKGVNLILAIDDAKSGRQLHRVDVNFSDFGYERVLLESGREAPRDFLISVSPQAVKHSSAAIGFSLALVELKPASEADQKRVAAQLAIFDSVDLLLAEKKEAKLQGFFSLGKALKLARESGDQILEATALILLERVYYAFGDFKKTIEYADTALPLLNSPENSYFQLVVKDAMVPALTAMNELSRSVELSQEIIAKAEALGDRRMVMSSLNNLTWANLRGSNIEKNIEYAEKSYQIAGDLGDTFTQVENLRAMGETYARLKDFDKSNEMLGKALLILKGKTNHSQTNNIYLDFADNYAALGQYQKAIDYYQQALEGFREAGVSKSWEEMALSKIANCYAIIGQNTRALDYNRQALEISSKFNYKLGNILDLVTKGKIYGALKDYQKSKEAYTEALHIAEELKDQQSMWRLYYYLSDMEKKFKHPEPALENSLKALEIRKNLKLPGGEEGLASLYLILGQTDKAEEYALRALERARATSDRITESNELYSLAIVRRNRKDLPAALHLIEDSLKIVESVRSELISQELRTSYFSVARYKYDFYISLLIEMQNQAENKNFGALAFAASERARSRGLLDLLAESYVDVAAGVAPDLKDKERNLGARLSGLQTQLIKLKSAVKPDAAQIDNLAKKIKIADEQREQLELEIKRTNPRYGSLKYPTTINLPQTQAMLDDKTVLLEYQTGAAASFLFAVSRKDFQIVQLPKEQSLRESVEAVRRSVSVPARAGVGNYLVAGRSLYQTLIEPVSALLQNKTKIIVSADGGGALNYLPFEVLLTKDSGEAGFERLPYMVRDFEISYTPSVSVLANLGRTDNVSAGAKPVKSFLAFADPDYGMKATSQALADQATRSVFGENRTWKLTELPNSKIEAERISKLFPIGQSTVFSGSEVTEERAESNELLSQYRYLHFAVHGLIDEEQPQFSSLVLSLPKTVEQSGDQAAGPNNKSQITNPKSQIPQDGLLQTPEIFNLRLHADLVTLSACETGLGQEIRGEGIVGLTQAFFYAGTPSVLVSLWSVNDASTADLMTDFYEQLRKNGERNKADALRQAKLKMLAEKRYAHPFYWAPFILQGKSAAGF